MDTEQTEQLQCIDEPSRCRICGCGVTLRIDPDCPAIHLDTWRKMVCCDRCHTHCIRMRSLKAAACKAVSQLVAAKMNLQFRQDKLEAVEKHVQETLSRITRLIAEQACKHWRAEFSWDYDFVLQIIEKPENTERTIELYERMVRRSAGK